MISKLTLLVRALIWEMKVFLKLKVQYPVKFPGARVASPLLPMHEKQVGKGTTIEEGVQLSGMVKQLGAGVYIGKNTSVQACTSIGNYSSISRDVKIGLMDHPQHLISTNPRFYLKKKGWVREDLFDEKAGEKCEIGHDVLISANVLVLAGVKVGNGAVIGAGAVVVKDVPPYAIVVGTPARIVKYRFDPPLIESLQKSRWWEVDQETLKTWNLHFDDPQKLAELASEYHYNQPVLQK